MAFEQLDKFTDEIAKQYKRTEDITFIIVLSNYHSTVLSHAKFRSQRIYCERIMSEICPSYCEGYFKKVK